MSRRLAAAVFACACFTNLVARGDDAAKRELTDREAEELVASKPESVDAWESRRPALIGWLRGRLGDAPAKQPARSADAAVRGPACTSHVLRRGDTECGALLVPAEHAGRGPAVIYLADGCPPAAADEDKKSSELARAAGEDLARSGYVVLLLYEAGQSDASPSDASPVKGDESAEWQTTTHADLAGIKFLLARREVDPDRVAVMGVGAAARRAWWMAALDERPAAVASLGTPASATLEDQVLLSLVAPRPHRLALDTQRVREREEAYRRWVAGPQDVYEWREVPRLFSRQLGAGFDTTPDAPAWRDTLRWLKDEL